MRIRQLFTILLTLCLILSLVGCHTLSVHTPLKAWEGEFSTDKWKDAITAFEAGYTPITLDFTWKVTLKISEPLTGAKISMVSPVEDDFGETELYIDTYIPVEYNKQSGELSFDCSWLNDKSSWVHTKPLWSFLIQATTESGATVYYYTRVTFKT